eukprot:CAMPEP_0198336654 /NCGR_PEP_ID=MMETSP1450-20131203/21111_1 /TAXON_ID=753684 ORGANISM="Madagascaria erythrocladiodes, Strain CCMP3234" /NCGR_SAMPLE_ID=MMETSP1450 /ASSEMBLY_ACC=CAM_ASM_001115 /LENGTH=505 /DNA_ID=CAMNT_0044041411 /DNA_START=75 /DNA_END=1592 /DNA_ORIENTATION=+
MKVSSALIWPCLFAGIAMPTFAAITPGRRPLRRAVIRQQVRLQPATRVVFGEATSGRIILNVFDTDYELDVQDESELTSGPSTFLTGSVVGVKHSQVELLVNEHGTTGTIEMKGKVLQVVAQGNGLAIESEIDTSKIEGPDAEPSKVDKAPFSVRSAVPHRELSESERQASSTYDALVAYTALAEQDNGGAAGTNNLIELMEGDMNKGYQNSLLSTRVRVVKTMKVDYNENSAGWSDHLNRFTSPTDGFMDDVHTVRENVGADVCFLLIAPTNDGSTAGIGWVGSRKETAFSVNENQFAARSTAAHEVGHNFGCGHDAATGGSGMDPWSRGYVNSGERVVTTMAYTCSGCSRINVHSMTTNFEGMKVGDGNSADCARTVKERTPIMADFLPRKNNPPPPPEETAKPPPPPPTGSTPCVDKGPSRQTSRKATLTIKNELDKDVFVFWINFDGEEEFVGKVASGFTNEFDTFVKHRFRVKGRRNVGNCRRNIVMWKTSREVVLGGNK